MVSFLLFLTIRSTNLLIEEMCLYLRGTQFILYHPCCLPLELDEGKSTWNKRQELQKSACSTSIDKIKRLKTWFAKLLFVESKWICGRKLAQAFWQIANLSFPLLLFFNVVVLLCRVRWYLSEQYTQLVEKWLVWGKIRSYLSMLVKSFY